VRAAPAAAAAPADGGQGACLLLAGDLQLLYSTQPPPPRGKRFRPSQASPTSSALRVPLSNEMEFPFRWRMKSKTKSARKADRYGHSENKSKFTNFDSAAFVYLRESVSGQSSENNLRNDSPPLFLSRSLFLASRRFFCYVFINEYVNQTDVDEAIFKLISV